MAGACSAGGLATATAVTAQEAPPPVEGPLPLGTCRLDPYHATLIVRVTHIGFSDYLASFGRFDATLEPDPADPESARLEAQIEVASLQTPTPPEGFRETLMAEPWFRLAEHPEIAFVSETVELTGPLTAEGTGVLSLNGMTRPATMLVRFNGGYAGHPFDPNARIGCRQRAA